jgi:hypothetical protein
VFVAKGGGVEFVPIPPPWPEDVDRLVQQIARATEKLIACRMRDQPGDDPPGLLEREQARSTEGAPFPRARSGSRSRQDSHQRAAFHFGYSLHAERHVDAGDRDALERLCRYGARAPIANSRLSLDDDGNAVIELKRPLYDGRTQLTFAPVELVRKLAVLIPPPRKNLTRYFGVFAPAHRYRSAIVPAGATEAHATTSAASPADATVETVDSATAPPPRPTRLSWAALLRRVFAIDILRCDRCGGAMKIIAVIPESSVADKILDHLGLELPASRATGPPLSGPHLH